MIAVLSPAKKLDWNRTVDDLEPTIPVLKKDTAELLEHAKQLSAKELGRMMQLSPALSKLNYDRFQVLEAPRRKPSAQSRMAALAFDGDTYQGLRAWEFGTEDLAFAQDHVRILSGLYGVLRPLDAIEPYRLEMGVRIDTDRGNSLYDFWGNLVARQLSKEARKHEHPLVVNLASTEYFTVARARELKVPVLTCVFKEVENGKGKVIGFAAKRARGMMARHIVANRITEPAPLKDFREAGYRFDARASTDSDWVFSRKR